MNARKTYNMATINLGNEGLESGDRIDDYLNDYFVEGNHVTIPPGEYDWHGGGLSINTDEDASLVGPAPGEVVFNMRGRFTSNWDVDGNSTVRISNIHFRGETTSSSQSRIGVWPKSGSTTLCEHLYFPDGNDGSASCRPFYSSTDRTGTAIFRNCYVANWTNNGFYTNKGSGATIYENCVVRNNNIGQIRIGADDSVVRGCLIILDEEPPTDNNSPNSRGVRVRSPGQNILVEDCDFIWTHRNGNPITLSNDVGSSSGEIRNCRFHSVVDPINDKTGGDADWVAIDCDFSGPNTDVDIDTENCRFGEADATPPDKTIEEVLGTDIGDVPMPEPSPPPEPPEGDVFEIIARQRGPLNYEFRVTGEDPHVTLWQTDGHEDGDNVVSGNGDVVQNDGDSLRVTGFTGNMGAGDAYVVDGEITDWSVDDHEYDYDLWLGEVQVSPEDLGYESPGVEPPEPVPEPPGREGTYEEGFEDGYTEGYEDGLADATDGDVQDALRDIFRDVLREELPDFVVGSGLLRLRRQPEGED